MEFELASQGHFVDNAGLRTPAHSRKGTYSNMLPHPPIDDEERLSTLRQFDILYTSPDPEYNRVTELLRATCDMNWAAITFVDRHCQWFKAHQGFDLSETSRAVSFCSVAMHLPQPLVVDDARLDPRFQHNALVTEDPHLRFYAGAPLVSSDGSPLGAVCIIDMKPRRLVPAQLALLCRVRDWVQATLELRRLDRIASASSSINPATKLAVQRGQTFARYRVMDTRELI